MHLIYYTLLIIVIFLTLPLWILRYFTTQKYRGTLQQRLGLQLPESIQSLSTHLSQNQTSNPYANHPPQRIWLHAVSVGEAMAARELATRLLIAFPNHELIISTVTKTGQEIVRKQIPAAKVIFYLPIDLPICINPVINALNPRFLVIMETELWPGLFRMLANRKIPIIVVNGRISLRSFKRYYQIRALTRQFLTDGRLFLMQSPPDAQRLITMGAPPERVKVIGNIKYDQALRPPAPQLMQQLTTRLTPPDQPVWIAASTHPGEEEIILTIFQQLTTHPQPLRLILVPRHPERAPAIMALMQQRNLPFQCFSKTHGNWHQPILLVDEIGWLAGLYRYAHFVFIGGTFVPHGGQNMLEAAAWGVPVLFGPHTFNFPEIAAQMVQIGAAQRVETPETLHAMALTLLTTPHQHQRMSEAARTLMPANAGALDRAITAIRQTIIDP